MRLLDEYQALAQRTEKRSAVMRWLLSLASGGTQIVVFATLKAKPNIPGAVIYWLERGTVLAEEEAEA